MKDYGFTKRHAQRLDVVEVYNRNKCTKDQFFSQLICIKQILIPSDVTHPWKHLPTKKRFKTMAQAENFWRKRLKADKVKKAVNPFTGKV